MIDLYPYQRTGVEWLATRPRALLADEMGLGKTAQAIAACAGARDRCVLVVCPASVKETWLREFKKFGTISPIVVSYDNAARGVLCMDPPPGDVWDVLILDECHYLKTPTSKRTRAIFGEKCDGVGGLVERADRVILLSGTPMPNNPAELWPILRAVFPETILSKAKRPYHFEQFMKKFCVVQDGDYGQIVRGGKNHDDLAKRLASVMLRRLKSEVLKDLPEIRFDTLHLEGRIPIEVQGSPEVELIRATLEEHGVEGLRSLTPHVATLRRLTGLAKIAPAADWTKTWLECCDDKLVIFAHHQEVIEGLYHYLKTETAHTLPLSGATPSKQRQRIIDEFQTNPKCRIFIGQIQAAGTGITLTASSDVLFVESSWVPAENQQAAMRVHRIGQKNACLIRFATLAGSIDEQIQRAVARKTADISQVLD